MSCNQCGMCCKALVVSISPFEAKRYVRNNWPFHDFKNKYQTHTEDIIFIAEDLKPLSFDEAIKINPEIKNWDISDSDKAYFYSCPHLADDNKCSIHDKLEKGHMCDGYPWYGKMPHETDWYSPNCGYKEGLKDYKE